VSNTALTLVAMMTEKGWTPEGTAFLIDRMDDPRLYSIMHRLLGVPRATRIEIPEHIRWEVWERDDFRCRGCGSRRYLHVDHILAISAGGTNALENLQTLCRSCNSKKGAK
jgi:5-methylcytosine-specific restriction protein A